MKKWGEGRFMCTWIGVGVPLPTGGVDAVGLGDVSPSSGAKAPVSAVERQ